MGLWDLYLLIWEWVWYCHVWEIEGHSRTYLHSMRRLNNWVRWEMRYTPPYFKCSGIILSGPGALFEASELMASSTSDVTMSARRKLSRLGDVSTFWCCRESACPSPENVLSLSKKSAHPLCMLSPWYSAPSKTSFSVGAAWVLLWFLKRRKSFSELEACNFLKKSKFYFRVALCTSFRNSLLHFLYWNLAGWSGSEGLPALFQ